MNNNNIFSKSLLNKIKLLIKKKCIVKNKINFPKNPNYNTVIKILKKHHKHISITEQKKQKLIKNKMPQIKINNNILTIKYFTYIYNNDNVFYKKYIKFVQKKLESCINKIKGIIIDLTDHNGGWHQPCFMSLSTTILNNTTLFGNTTNKKKIILSENWINIRNKKLFMNEPFLTNKINTNLKVAVLVSNKTSSSGEFCASIFKRNIKNVKIFGENTKGYLTVNYPYPINEKYTINIPLSYCKTVNKKIQIKEYIKPDIYTNKPMTDAKKWISKK